MRLPTDLSELEELYDITSERHRTHGGDFQGDLHAELGRLRSSGPVHAGSIAELVGAPYGDYMAGDSVPHYSAFDWRTCAEIFRDSSVFSSAIHRERPVMGGETSSIIGMDGDEHRRHRAIVQPKFVRKQAEWWVNRFISPTVTDLIDTFRESGQADLGLQFFAGIPLFVTTRSLGIGDEEAFEYAHLSNLMFESSSYEASEEIHQRLLPLIHARRTNPGDDLVSVLSQAELPSESGMFRLTDEEITAFTRLLLVGGIGTTWRQLGILTLVLLGDRDLLDQIEADSSLISDAAHESLRWEPNIPLMRRLVVADTELGGVNIPKGAIVEASISAANRDPSRWDGPDKFDVSRKIKTQMGYGGGPHVCLGMHVANAQMYIAVKSMLERLPNLRLDPDRPTPRIVGFEHRAVTSLPVVFDGVSVH